MKADHVGKQRKTYFVSGQTDVNSPHLNFTQAGNISLDPRNLWLKTLASVEYARTKFTSVWPRGMYYGRAELYK
jgi:hypothetical protein